MVWHPRVSRKLKKEKEKTSRLTSNEQVSLAEGELVLMDLRSEVARKDAALKRQQVLIRATD